MKQKHSLLFCYRGQHNLITAGLLQRSCLEHSAASGSVRRTGWEAVSTEAEGCLWADNCPGTAGTRIMFLEQITLTGSLLPHTPDREGRGRTGCRACWAKEGQGRGLPICVRRAPPSGGQGPVTRLSPQQGPASFSPVGFCLVGKLLCFPTKSGNF